MRKIFPDGVVPITSPFPTAARLGSATRCNDEEVYFISLRHVSTVQLEAMAQDMVDRGCGSIEEAREVLGRQSELPARAFHFSGTSSPLRFIL